MMMFTDKMQEAFVAACMAVAGAATAVASAANAVAKLATDVREKKMKLVAMHACVTRGDSPVYAQDNCDRMHA